MQVRPQYYPYDPLIWPEYGECRLIFLIFARFELLLPLFKIFPKRLGRPGLSIVLFRRF